MVEPVGRRIRSTQNPRTPRSSPGTPSAAGSSPSQPLLRRCPGWLERHIRERMRRLGSSCSLIMKR